MTEQDVLDYFNFKEPDETQHEEADQFQPVYFFAMGKKNRRQHRCSRCKQIVGFDKVKHLDWVKCPECGHTGEVIHLWRYKRNYVVPLRRNVLTYHLDKSQIAPDVITCKAVYSMYEVFKDEAAIRTTRFTEAWYVFIPDEGGYCVTWNRRWYPDWDSGDGYGGEHYYSRYTSLRKKCRSRHNVYEARYRADSAVEVHRPSAERWRDVTAGQRLQYAVDFYAKDLSGDYNFIELADRIAKWPLAMEQLGKIGFKEMFIEAAEKGHGLGNAFNMRGKSVKAMLRGKITRQDMAYIHEGRITAGTYGRWATIRKHCKYNDVSLELFDKHLNIHRDTEVKQILNYTNAERLVAYLDKQKAKYPDARVDLRLYADYINDCMKLEMNLKEKAVLFPGNLPLMHINLASQIEYKANAILEDKYAGRYKKLLKSYAYTDDIYSIVVPARVGDLIREGKMQQICVGQYIDRVADGKTDVVYIRRNDALEMPLCTMEIRAGQIIQVRAKYNGKPPEEVRDFVEKFRRDKLEKGA
jgi:DNA-directed RNA polymerase subunit RPC12/RpoP